MAENRTTARLLAILSFLFLAGGRAGAQQVHKNGFEGREPVWIKAGADAAFRENQHATTNLVAHGGQRSEHLQITAERGSFVYYQYATGRALVNDELSASVWVRSSRPGVQLLARLVLPHEPNPNSLDEKMTALIRGDLVRSAGHWQRLEIRRPVELVKQQQALLQATLKRPVNFKDAYVDALLLNVYTGPGQTEVWIDDLELGPVLDPVRPFQNAGRTKEGAGPAPAQPAQRHLTRPVSVEHVQDQLLVGGQRFFLRGIRYGGTPLGVLRDAGFNTLFVDAATPPAALQQAVDQGFWLVPQLPASVNDAHLVSAENVGREITGFPFGDAVLMWDLGGALTSEQAPGVLRAAQLIHSADPGRPVAGDVWDGFLPYSRGLDLVGAHRWPLMTSLELSKYREWLNQRRLLANPGTFLWTWVQTHLPDWYLSQVYGRSAEGDFKEPIGPQPEQIRLLTYTALAAGCRGVGFWSDRFLADSHQGRDRLQVLALLNQELEMLEPVLTGVDDPPIWIDTSIPEVKAAVLHSPRGVLVLPMWLGLGAQFVPGQSAAVKLSMVVPMVPEGVQVWEVTPGHVHAHLQPKRVPGGTLIVIPEFGLTSAVVFTADMSLIISFQEQARAKSKLAAQWTRDLAHLELAKVLPIEQQLEAAGHTLPDGRQLLEDSRKRLKRCEELWNNHMYSEAYLEGQRALRPIRILMRAQWEQALRKTSLTTPVATPYATGFYTLPRHWALMEQLQRLKPAANVLRDGGFEVPITVAMKDWVRQDLTLDPVELVARRVNVVTVEEPKAPAQPPRPAAQATTSAKGTVPPQAIPPAPPATPAPKPTPPVIERVKEGKQCLMLEIKPKDKVDPPGALQRTFLAIHTPAVRLPPGTWVRVSAWVRIPKPIGASADGALIYDSAGGEPLAVRLTDPLPWKQYVLYRQVPASGLIHVTLALTGLGRVYFDDVRIEPLTAE